VSERAGAAGHYCNDSSQASAGVTGSAPKTALLLSADVVHAHRVFGIDAAAEHADGRRVRAVSATKLDETTVPSPAKRSRGAPAAGWNQTLLMLADGPSRRRAGPACSLDAEGTRRAARRQKAAYATIGRHPNGIRITRHENPRRQLLGTTTENIGCQ